MATSLTPEDWDRMHAMIERSACALPAPALVAPKPKAPINWPAWVMSLVTAALLAVGAYSANSILGNNTRLAVAEKTQTDLGTRVGNLEIEVRSGFEKTNEKLNILVGRQAAANGGRR